MGIEPTSQAWEARILPMYYTRKFIHVSIKNLYGLQKFFLRRYRSYYLLSVNNSRTVKYCTNKVALVLYRYAWAFALRLFTKAVC